MPLQNIALIGANGTLGPAVLRALSSTPNFHVSVLTRASSKSTYPSTVRTITVPDSLPVSELTDALRGQDALVITMAGSYVAESIRLADACYAAGVARIIPADFGSCDSADEHTLALLPLMAGKAKVRRHLQELAQGEGSTLSWTSIITGHFFDFGLMHGLLRFHMQERKAQILDGGEIRWSATTLDTIGAAVVRALERDDVTKNRILYIHSFCVSQNEVLRILEKITGAKWEVEHVHAQEVIDANREKANQGDRDAIEEIVSVHGLVASNWEGKEGYANDLLELGTEDLDDVVRRVVPS